VNFSVPVHCKTVKRQRLNIANTPCAWRKRWPHGAKASTMASKSMIPDLLH
jgi:hypothetical protein